LLPFEIPLMETPLRILTVDNEPSVTLSMRYVFDGPRYELTTMDNGPAALAMLETNPYDVIIVDEKMPELTGVELVSAIKQRGISGKIIVVSAHLSPPLRAAYEQMGVRVMLPKPFDVALPRSAVNHLVI
jgi:CheY-like chemotaxis protein